MTHSKVKSDPKLLILSGLDPTGHAGILRDQSIAQWIGVNSTAFPTAITQQTDLVYEGTYYFKRNYFTELRNFIKKQKISTIKIGMLGDTQTIKGIIDIVTALKTSKSNPFVIWDPIIQSTSGGELVSPAGLKLAMNQLLPLTNLITPNIPEVLNLLKLKQTHELSLLQLAELWWKTFKTPIYLKGGHSQKKAIDVYFDGKAVQTFTGSAQKKTIRGTGCVLSTAIASHYVQTKNLHNSLQQSKTLLNDLFSGRITF